MLSFEPRDPSAYGDLNDIEPLQRSEDVAEDGGVNVFSTMLQNASL
jgi:hypothetical protein